MHILCQWWIPTPNQYMLYNSDLCHGPEFDWNEEASWDSSQISMHLEIIFNLLIWQNLMSLFITLNLWMVKLYHDLGLYQLLYSKYMQNMQINLDNWRFHNRLKTSVVKRNSSHFRTALCEYVCVRPSVKIFLVSKLFQKYVMYFQIWGKFTKFISLDFFEKTTLNSFYFFSKCVLEFKIDNKGRIRSLVCYYHALTINVTLIFRVSDFWYISKSV